MTVSQKTATASIWTIGGKFLARILDFITLLVLARLLSPEDFGLVAIATSLLVIAEAVLDLPLVQALVRQTELSRPILKTAFTLSLLRGVVIVASMMSLAWPLAWFYEEPRLLALIAVMSLAPAMRSINSPCMVVFMQRFDFRRDFVLDVGGKLVALVCSVALAYATGSYWSLAVGAVVGPAFSAVVSYVFAPMRPGFSLSEWRLFRDMIGWNSVSQILTSLNWQLDRLLLPRFTPLSTFAAFSVADNLAGITHQTFVNPLMRPLMAAFAGLDDRLKLQLAYAKATSAITLVATPLLLVLAVLAEPVIRIILGDKWAMAGPILQILCLINLLSLPANLMPPLAMILDKTRYLALRTFLEFVARMPVALIAIPLLGITGAFYSRLATVVVAYVASLVITKHLIGLSCMSQLWAFARPLMVAVPAAAFLVSVQPALASMVTGVELAVLLLLAGGSALALYWMSALLLWRLTGRPAGLEALVIQRLFAAITVLPFQKGVSR